MMLRNYSSRPPADDGHRRLLTERMFAFAPVPVPEGNQNIDACFQSTESLWRPLWGRGVYGGGLVGQALAVAQETVDLESGLLVHSMHCHFLRPVRDTASVPVIYNVDRVRDGRSVAIRLVLAYQAGKAVFSATLSFAREEGSSAKTMAAGPSKILSHQVPLPAVARRQGPPTQRPGEAVDPPALLSPTCQVDQGSVFESVRVTADEGKDKDKETAQPQPDQVRLHQWIRACSETSNSDGGQPTLAARRKAHLAALAYMSDYYFIGTVFRAHRTRRFNGSAAIASRTRALDASTPAGRHQLDAFAALQREEADELARASRGERWNDTAVVEMMVSLDHTIYFHQPTAVRADEWMFVEVETPWAGHERGLVVAHIWARDGTLLASCFQEGLVRLAQPVTGPRSKM